MYIADHCSSLAILLTAGACASSDGCGFYDGGSALAITGMGGHGRAIFANANTLTADGGLEDFDLQFQSGSTAHVSTITTQYLL